MSVDQIENFVQGRLVAGVDATTTTFPVSDAANFPDPSDEDAGGSYRCIVYADSYVAASEDPDREIVEVTARDVDANELTVVRGKENTTAASHPTASNIYNAYTAAFRDDILAIFDDDSTQQLYVSTEGDDSNSGASRRDAFATISRALDEVRATRDQSLDASLPAPVRIRVDAGEYQVDNPLDIPRRTSLMGTDVRACQLFPKNPKVDFCHVDSMSHLWGLRFYDHQSPAFTVSFERVVAEADIVGGQLDSVDVYWSPKGYLEGDNDSVPEVVIDPPRDTSGTQAQAEVIINNGEVTDVTVTDPGSGYQTKPTVSIPAPEDEQPYIIASPYPLNCSTITGPFDENGDQIPRTAPLPYDTSDPEFFNPITQQQESYAAVDPEGAGGGMLIDGRLTFGRNSMTDNSNTPRSPIPSMVAAQFTQVNQGGPGHLVINDGFAQFVSMFTTYCTFGFKCKSGGLALISNSVCDFGIEGLVSEGKQRTPYTTGTVTQDYFSQVAAVSVEESGSGYTEANTDIVIDPPANGSDTATAEAVVDNGSVVGAIVTNQGSGYESVPDITVNGDGTDATVTLQMDKVASVTVENLDEFTQPGGNIITRRPEINSVIELNGRERTINSWSEDDGVYTINFRPGVFDVTGGTAAKFYQLSNINSGGHLFEFPGTGVTYNALPEYGGQIDLSQMTKEFGSGRTYHTSSDSFGNFYVGDQFEINQATGEVTLNTDQFNLSGLNSVGPFEINGVTRGVALREVSNRNDLVSNSGLPGNTVPTVRALREFFLARNRTVPNGGQDGEALVKQSADDRDADWQDVLTQSEFDSQIKVDGQPLDPSDTLNFKTN